MAGMKLMATDNGKHPPEKWAEVMADDIMDIGASAPEALLREATELRRRLVAHFTHHVAKAAEHEQTNLAEGDVALHEAFETHLHAPDCVQGIVDLARGTSFAKHFAQEHVQAHLHQVCHQKLASVMNVERIHHYATKAEQPAVEQE